MSEPAPVPRVDQLLILARSDPRAAEVAFQSIAPEAQAALVAIAPAADRLQLLLLAHDCAPVVRALSAPVLAQTAIAAGDDADVLARYATAEQLAAAIDIDCRRQGRLRPSRFHRWIALLVAASTHEAATAIPLMDVRLLVVGLRPFVRLTPGVRERERLERYRGGEPFVTCEDIESDDEDVAAFLRLLEETAPAVLATLGGLLIEEDAEESFAEDYAAHEQRMAAIGLKDYASAAEVYGPRPSPAQDTIRAPASGGELIAGDDRSFLRDAIAALVAHAACDDALIERLGHAMVTLANDVAIADGAGADVVAALAARTKVEQLIAVGLRRRADGDVHRAAEILLTTALGTLLREGCS